MNNQIPKNIKAIIVIAVIILIFSNLSLAYAQTSSQVSASVGKYLLNVSGIISPYASISLIGQSASGNSKNPIKAIVADSEGKFVFSNVLVAPGFSNTCFEAVDIKRLGDSYTCLTIAPIIKNTTIEDIFLPPTVNLEKDQINQGDSLTIQGYSMPSASVTLTLSDGRSVVVNADSTGFYETKLSMPKPGKFELFAAASYQGKASLTPAKKKSFLVLNFSQELTNLLKLLLSPPLVLIWPLFIAIILLIIFLRKHLPDFIFPFYKKRKKKKDQG